VPVRGAAASRTDVGVILVEDHQMFAQALRQALEEQGIRVLGSVATVAEARAAVRERRPDVVVIDHLLPDGDGVAAARVVREAAPSTPVIILTGAGDDGVLVQALGAGCAGYVTKDQQIEDLAAAIRAARAGATLISPTTLHRLSRRLGGGMPWVGSDLSAREVEILHLVAEGLLNKEIADRVRLSVHTVRNHVHSVITKLGGHSKLEAVAIAQREGILKSGRARAAPPTRC
jgi:DNA-binding NarL/FixJ family response regulator